VTILLWGVSEERPFADVRERLERLRAPLFLLDQQAVLETAVDLVVGAEVHGSIRSRGQRVDLRAVTALYLRPYDSRLIPVVTRVRPSSAAWQHALAVEAALYLWADLAPALVVNRPSAMAANGSKPYQLEQLRRLGFCVPETLITTDPAEVRAFWERHGEVVYKSVSGVRSIVARLRPEHVDRLSDVACCPTQFQQYIRGTDVRVHVVGDQLFACQIACAADDYRYPGRYAVDMRACALPREVEERCLEAARAMRLQVAGIDLRRTLANEWYCFEVNPSPAFTYFQRATRQPIGEAIAQLLRGASAK
jgi:glutathione synthase/RimK-type ligase-like ATP-grasp enzyme